MSTFTYDKEVPTPTHNPSADVSAMQTNSRSIRDWTAIDHVAIDYAGPDNNSGTHLQTTFSSKNAAGAQTDPQSTLYTGNGTASTVADLFFRNQNATFRPTIIKAAARIQGVSPLSVFPIAVTSITNAYNVVSAIQTNSTTFQITLASNAAVGTVSVPITSLELGGIIGYVVSTSLSGNVLTVVISRTSGAATDVFLNFAILQV